MLPIVGHPGLFLFAGPIVTKPDCARSRNFQRGVRSDRASIRRSWPGCWRWNGSRVASWRSSSWISRTRRPGRNVGRCTGRSLGAGGSRPLDSPGDRSKSERFVGSWRAGADRPSSSWRWTVWPSSASPVSRPPGAWTCWNGPSWSPSAVCQVGLRSLQSWTWGPSRGNVKLSVTGLIIRLQQASLWLEWTDELADAIPN